MFDSGWERGPEAAFSRAWSTETPDAGLVAALMSTPPVDPVDDDGYDAVERLGAWEAVAAWAQSCQVQTAADLLASRQARAARSGVGQRDEFAATAMELATMARVAPVTGEHRLHQAVCLVERLPQTFERLREGRIAYSHARVLLEQTHDCTDETATAADARYWSSPSGGENLERTPTQTRERIRRVLQRVDPDSVRRRAQQARRGRTVRYWSDDDGATGVITLRLPAPEARGVFAVIDAAAQHAADPPGTPPEDRRSLGQRRADAAVDLIMTGATTASSASSAAPDAAPDAESAAPRGATSGCAGSGGAGSGGAVSGGAVSTCGCGGRARVQTQVRVLIPWQTLAGGNEPAELEGHGPIPADQARRMTANGADSVLQRLLTDPITGTARHLDLRRYRPPPSLRALIEDRDQYCHAPGCRRPARTCDLDHVIAYDHTAPTGGAGRTHPDRLKPECRRHHNLKTRRHWHCEPHHEPGEPPGVLWTSPSGHTWIVRAPSLTEPDLSHEPDPVHAPDLLVTT